MKKNNDEFDIDRMKIYMSLPAEAKLKHLEEANNFFSKFRNKSIDKIRQELRRRGF